MAAQGVKVVDEKLHKHPEWYPLPAGVYTAGAFGMVALLYVVYAFANDQWGWGLISISLGALAIFEVGTAAYTAGLRRENLAEQLRRKRDAEKYRAPRSSLSKSGAGVHQESEEEAEN